MDAEGATPSARDGARSSWSWAPSRFVVVTSGQRPSFGEAPHRSAVRVVEPVDALRIDGDSMNELRGGGQGGRCATADGYALHRAVRRAAGLDPVDARRIHRDARGDQAGS